MSESSANLESSSPSEDAPLGVHVLTELVYCPRAGVIAYESRAKDRGLEPGVSNLNYSPPYDLIELDEQLLSAERRISLWVLLFGVGLAMTWLVPHQLGNLAFLMVIFGIWVAINVWQEIWHLFQLLQLRWDLKSMSNWLPDLENPDPENLNWWRLIKTGFDLFPVRDDYRDDDLGLQGHPWKVLRYGEWVIPVFLRRPGEIHPQHFVRIGAYCQLIEACEGARSPFGIVLTKSNYDAVAIKWNDETKDALDRGLDEARHILREHTEGVVVAERPAHFCKKCPLGSPRPHRPGETELVCNDKVVPIHCHGERRLHSQCGDRFQWVPPHKLAIETGLLDDSES